VVSALELCWRAARTPAGKRLAPMLVVLVPLLRRDGELDLDDDEAALLVAMSAATIDRRLAGAKVLAGFRATSHTKPGSLLKTQIPIRTWSEWDDVAPGFVEIDLVGHEGGNSFGEFCFTLTMTDIATGWTVNRSVANKSAIRVAQAIEHACGAFPFPIVGIDSDNGSEFINAHFLEWCSARRIGRVMRREAKKPGRPLRQSDDDALPAGANRSETFPGEFCGRYVPPHRTIVCGDPNAPVMNLDPNEWPRCTTVEDPSQPPLLHPSRRPRVPRRLIPWGQA
jgi:hypothetical protein